MAVAVGLTVAVEEDLGDSDHGKFIGDVSGTLGVDIKTFPTVEILLVLPGSSLSESTAVYQCEGLDEWS